MELCREHVPAARRCARMLLSAWNTADLRQLQNAIRQTLAAGSGPESADFERLEMVQEIAGVIREWMAGHKSSADLKASLELLRHLANEGRFRPASDRGEVPQPAALPL
jgi:hypothetical protein